MRWAVFFPICIAIAGCEVAQPESLQTVAAFEIPLPSEHDRAEFLSVLRQVAEAEGCHVDSASQEELEGLAEVVPTGPRTVHADVWRGVDDNEPVATAMDFHDRLGRVWIMFAKGEDPVLAGRFRERAMREILLRWPETLSLPIMPTGAIPLARDLIRTPDGYILDPSVAPRYELDTLKPRM